jgi:hypothetical protein
MSAFYDLAVAWDWEFDAGFLHVLEREIHARGLLTYLISYHNAPETCGRLQAGELSFGAFLDRAGESDEIFARLGRTVRTTSAYFINAPEAIARANDKATMHLEFLSHGLDVPFTIIISPYSKKKEVELKLSDLRKLGRPFIIKPANTTGGGVGVILGAETLKEVIDSRQHHKNDKYLLQEKIVPGVMGETKAWFRVFSVFDLVLPCWWDDVTHRYRPVSDRECDMFGLRRLRTMTGSIKDVCALDFFSTEIAVTPENRCVVVDYVNDICDMRLQSAHFDGVPDVTIALICRRIAEALPLIIRNRPPHIRAPGSEGST